MKRLALLATLPLLLAASPEERPAPTPGEKPEAAGEWPQKGDVLYIAADIASYVILEERSDWTLPRCSPVTLMKRDKDTAALVVKPHEKGQSYFPLRLRGTWGPLLHRTEIACHQAFARDGQPKMIDNGLGHIIP